MVSYSSVLVEIFLSYFQVSINQGKFIAEVLFQKWEFFKCSILKNKFQNWSRCSNKRNQYRSISPAKAGNMYLWTGATLIVLFRE